LKERILEILKALGLNQKDLAIALDVSPGSISDWLNRDILPKAEVLSKFNSVFNINTNWLLNGSGSMFVTVIKECDCKQCEELKDKLKELESEVSAYDRIFLKLSTKQAQFRRTVKTGS